MKNVTYKYVKSMLDIANLDLESCQMIDKKNCPDCERQRNIVTMCKAWIRAYVARWVRQATYIDLVTYDGQHLQQMFVCEKITPSGSKEYYAKVYNEAGLFDTKEEAKKFVESRAKKLGIVVKNAK
jgi:hypothetical protein